MKKVHHFLLKLLASMMLAGLCFVFFTNLLFAQKIADSDNRSGRQATLEPSFQLFSADLIKFSIPNATENRRGEQTPVPTCSCILAVGAFSGDSTVFDSCSTNPGVINCPCTNCNYFTVQLQCNDGCTCCIDQITITGPNGVCFDACAKVNTPTSPWWIIGGSRGNSCEANPMTLTPSSGGVDLCSYGAVLTIKLCGGSGTYTIQGRTTGDCTGVGGTITAQITI